MKGFLFLIILLFIANPITAGINLSDKAMMIQFPRFKTIEEARKFGRGLGDGDINRKYLMQAIVTLEKNDEEQANYYKEALRATGYVGASFYGGSVTVGGEK